MQSYKKLISVLIVMMVIFTTCAHHHHTLSAKSQLITIHKQPLGTTLYYSGIVEPFGGAVITSPVDGVISQMSFHYGDVVKPNQLLFLLSSEKFQADYKTALTQYIKAKNDFMDGQSQLKESQFLHKNQLISDDDFKAKQTTFYNSQLAMVQAKDTLAQLLKQINFKGVDIFNLKIADIDKISQLLQVQNGTQTLQISTPEAGVVLLPNKKGGAEGEIDKISQGDLVKQGDVLAVIGNVSGLKVQISVSEFNINQLRVGQNVTVTGAAFPDYSLPGQISGLDHQAQSSQGGLPTFSVEVTVKNLTPAQQAVIHMGMSAKVAIQTGGDEELTVPIKAVFFKNNQAFITVLDKKTNEPRDMPVKTGQTTLDAVVLTDANLVDGDQVVVVN